MTLRVAVVALIVPVTVTLAVAIWPLLMRFTYFRIKLKRMNDFRTQVNIQWLQSMKAINFSDVSKKKSRLAHTNIFSFEVNRKAQFAKNISV